MNFIRPSDGRITSNFSKARLDPVAHKEVRSHNGTDFGKDGSDRILASMAGKVVRAGEAGGFGNAVYLQHVYGGKTIHTIYAHMSKLLVKVGQQVKQGQQIGVMGSSGRVSGKHLHFEIHLGPFTTAGTYAVDPLHYISDPHTKEIQGLLVKAGYSIAVDGIEGPATEKAITDFQKKNGLVADGIAGVMTKSKLVGVTTVSNTRFKDIPKSHKLYDVLERLAKKGVIAGFPDGTYRPNETITREQLALLLDKHIKG